MEHTRAIVTLILLGLIANMASAVNPGFKMRVTKKGIDYANTVAQAALRQDIQSLRIPDQSGGGSLSWSLTNIQTESVSGPTSNIALNPGQQGLTWTLSNFGINLKANWRARYKRGWFKVSSSGSVRVGFSGVSLTVTASIGEKNGRPSISMRGCNANIGRVSVHFRGGIGWILNLFKGTVERKIKQILQSKICDVVTKEVNTDAEAALAKMKVTVPIANRFLLDYSLVQPAAVTADHLSTFHKGEVYWRADKKESPFSPGPIPEWRESGSMLYLWLTEYTANTFAYTAHNHGFLKYEITRTDLPGGHGDFLSTSCQDICLGTLFPQIAERYPDSWVELRVKSNKIPTIKVVNESVVVSLWADTEMHVHTPDNRVVNLVTLNVSLSIAVRPTLANEKIRGAIANHSFDVGVVKSNIGELDISQLKKLLGGALDFIVIPGFNNIGKIGLDLPVTGDIKFRNTRLQLLQGILMVSTDVQYLK